MPDILYTSPATNRSYKWVPEDPNYVPTESDIKDYALYIEQQEGGLKQSALGAFGSGVGQGLATMPGTVLQGVGAMVGSTGLEEAGKYSAQQAREAFPIDPMRREDLTTQAGQAVGQALAQLGLAVGTGGGSIGTGLVLGTAAAMGAASGSDRAAESGLTGARRMGRVYGSALTELASERLFGLGSKSFFSPAKIPTTFGGKALRAAGTAAGEGGEEIAAGVGNNVLDNLTALGLDIPTPDIVGMKAFKSYGEQGLLGIVGGTVFAGAQLALGSQAAATPVTRSFATVDGVETEVTGMTEDDLKSMRVDPATVRHETVLPAEDARVASSIQNPNVRNLVTEMQSSTDTNALDSALNLGAAANVLTQAAASVAPPVTPAPSVTPAPEVTPASEPTAVVSPAPEVAPAAAQSVEIPATGPTNLVDIANAGFTGTINQTPPPDATQIRPVPESNLGQYPDGNEVGPTTEAGDSNRPVEGGQVEQAPVVQEQEVAPAEVPTAEAPVQLTNLTTGPSAARNLDIAGIKAREQAKKAASKKAAKAAPALAPEAVPVPTTPPTTQEIVDSIQSIEAGVTGETAPAPAPETLGTGTTAPSETISLQQESVPTGSLPAAEAPMTGVSGEAAAATTPTPAAAAPTPEAAQTSAPEAAAPTAEAEPSLDSVEDIPVEGPPKQPEPDVAEAEDTSVLGKIKSKISQFMGKENPLSPKEVQSYRKLLEELVRPHYFNGSSAHNSKNDEKFYKFVDILQNGDAVNKLRELGIEINADLGANDALPGAILVELYKYANSQKNSDKMLRDLETVGSTFYYNVGGQGRSSARGLGIIQFGLKELARAKQTSIANKARLESAAKRTGVTSADIEGTQKAADTATVDEGEIAAGLEEVSVPNGESVAAIVTPLLNSVPQQKKTETRPTPGEQTPTEADFAAEAERKRLEQEAKGQDPETNEQIRESLYTKVDGAVTNPTINATKARELIAKKLGFTPKNVSYENTDIPNENGNQYSGKVNLATKQITINLRNIKDSAHLEDVLIEEMDHLVYADPMVQAEISLLSENLPDDIKAEVASLNYKPEVQVEEATIRFMRRLANEPNTSSLWKRFVDSVRAAFRRLFNGRLTERDLKMAADRVAARSFRAMAAQSNLTGTRFSLTPLSPEAQRIDQEYMAAVEAGDMAKAQRLVDEAAKAAAKPFSVKTQRKGFSTETAVSIGDKTVSVFRDPENGYWYFADKGGLGNYIATSKENAIQAALERIEDEQGGAKASTTVQFRDWKKQTTITLPGFYLRFGDLPKEGKSVKGNQPGEFEQGVSVLKAWRSPNGVFVISSYTSETGSSDMVSGLENRPVFIAYGEDTGKVGSDGEPLLKDVVLTEQVINNLITVDDPSYIDQPITNNVTTYDKWKTIEPAPDPLASAETVVRDGTGKIIPPSKRFEEAPDIRYSLPDPNEPAPAVPDVGPNALTRETVAAESVLDRLNKFILGYERESNEPKTAAKKAAAKKVAKKAAAPKPKPKKEEVDPNVSAVKKFIKEFTDNSGVEKADAEPKVKNPAKETLQRYTKLPKKKDGPGYPLDEDGETAFMSDLTQELVDLGVPVALAAEASAYAWARYSTKKQDQIDKKALAEFEKAQTEKARQEKRTEAEAQAAKDKPNNTAKAYIKNASADPSTAKEKVKNPVTQALNEAAKIPRKGPAFDSSPQAKNAFMTGLSSKLMSLGVDSQTAWSASNVAWDKYQTALEARAASLLKEFEKNIPATLARKIKELPVFRQNDAEYVRQYIKDLFIFAGLTPEVAEAATTLYSAKYAQMLKDARVKAATKYIENEASPRTKDVLKKRPNELDKILEAIRLGVTDPSMTVALALSDQSKFQVFTQEEHNRMVALEEEINDEDTLELIKLERTKELMKLAESKMNDFNAIKAFTGYLVGNTLSGIGTAAIQLWTPAYSMGNRLATDGMRGLLTGDPKRFFASLSAFMNSADTVTSEFKYAFGNDVYRRGQQAELKALSDLRKVLDKNIPIYQNPKSGKEKVVAMAKIALAAPDYVRRLYSSMDTASQSLFINQIRQVGLYDLLRKNGMDMEKFQIMLEAKRAYRDATITTLTLEGKYTPTQIRLIAEDSAIEDFGVRVAEAIGADGAQQVADLFRTSDNEGKSEIGVSDQVDGHVIPAILKILKGIETSVDDVAGEKGQGAGQLAFRVIVGYPTTALKVLNRSLYFFPPTAALRYLTNRYYEKQPDFDPKADRVYPLLETHSQKLQRISEGVMGMFASAILLALLIDEKDKEEKDRRFAVHNLGPSDRAAKQAWRAAGNVPQSIQWRASETSPWISVSWAKAGLEAMAPVLALAGTMYDVGDEAADDAEFSDQLIKATSGFMGVFNRPLSGINDIGEILSGEKNSISQKSLASYTAFRASGLVPFSSLLKTVNRLEGPRDMSTATSTMLSQIPIAGPMLTEPAINMFGDPLGATPNEMSYKMPILPVQVGIRRQDVPFYEKILSKGQYPPLKLRTNFEKTYGPVSDLVWRQYVEKRGQMVKKLIIDRWTDLDKLSPEAYDKVLGKFANAADDVAIQELNIRRLPK
jgi:hypothetical protein